MEGRVKESGGPHVPDRAKLADFVKMDNALRSIQIIQEDGTFTGYNQDADIRDFKNPMDSSLHNLAREVCRSGNVSITPSMEVGNGLRDIVVLRPVFLPDDKGNRHFWGYILAIIDTRIFLKDANVSNLEDQNILCSLIHTEGDGTVSEVYENGNYGEDSLVISREIYGDSWTLYLHPKGPWVNPWIIVVITRAGLLTALTLAVLARRNARLRRMGTTDPLTGVYNRTGGDWTVRHYLEAHQNEPALVMAVDIDNFKIINDVYGHEAGDEALCQFTRDMKETFGQSAVITRNGGDEFIIFCGYGWSRKAAEAIDCFTEKPHIITYKGKEIQFSASLGLARYPEQDRDYRNLCIKADYALYGAKLNGKSRWQEFDPDLRLKDTRTQLGFNLTDIGNEMPGAMAVYRADDRSILFASSTLVELMECDSLDDFMKYTKMSLDRIFPDSEKETARAAIDRQLENPSNRHLFYFITANILTKKGNLCPVEIRGHRSHNANYGDVIYIFLYEKEQKES
jgi:diguanylate cyclase (GGDEF)-like protein